jgi:hypothetical protein
VPRKRAQRINAAFEVLAPPRDVRADRVGRSRPEPARERANDLQLAFEPVGTTTQTRASARESLLLCAVMKKEEEDGAAEASPEREAERLEERVDAIRGDLGSLVSELERRRHRAGRPLLVVASATLALAAVGAGGLLYWRHRRRRSTRFRAFAAALRRSVAHPERVAAKRDRPSLGKKIAAAGAASLASVIARRAAQRLVAPARKGDGGRRGTN